MIRAILGFFMVYGAVGGMEQFNDDNTLMIQAGIAALGLMLMYFGFKKMANQ